MSGVLIADEMGLGKTVQALAVLAATDAYPAVVVCPASLRLNWERETRKWLPGRTVEVLSGTKAVPRREWPDVVVLNYDVLHAWSDTLPVPRALVLDESHCVKNADARRTKAAIRLADRMPDNALRLCLSGTPVMNKPGELLTQLRILGRLEEFGGAQAFKDRYVHGPRNLTELNRRLRATCFVRRRKEDVLTELPPKRWSDLYVEGDPQVMARYRRAEQDVVSFLADRAREAALASGATEEQAQRAAWERALRAQSAEHLAAVGALKKLAAEAKMPAVRQWIADFTESGGKLVAFGHHRDIVGALDEQFAHGCRVQGGMDAEARQAAVDRFQTDPDQKVIACSLNAAGVGLTLTAASDVLFVEQGWTPAAMDQAADRCHRIGQVDSVTAWNVLAAGTIDEDVAALIARKREIVDAATDGRTPDGDDVQSVLGDLLVRLAERGLAT